MFVRQNQQQFRNSNADVQIFYGSNTGTIDLFSWNKPPGVSHVYMLLIGAGADGDTSTGGGSGSVTVWYGAAQNVPDNLVLVVGGPRGGSKTIVRYRNTSGTPNTLLNADNGATPTGASATGAGVFAASGFYQSIAGQDGTSAAQGDSGTTFLTGGAGTASTNNASYGYGLNNTGNGFFQLQPIIVGEGGAGSGNGGIGCGGGMSSGRGGQGMILIASW
jgi:hypothetical protein